jgi:nucleoside-diphosphate-sugar epimerase
MTERLHVFLAGASRGVGWEIAKILATQAVKVTALLRSDAVRVELEAMGMQVAIADALNAAEIERVMTSAEPIDAVVSTIGGLPQDGQRPDFWGNKNLIDTAVKVGVKKFILVTSIGSGNSAGALPPQVLQALGAVLIEKEKAEQHLMASGLTYTIIRPGGLKSEPATGNGVLTEDITVAGPIHRPDVADLVCQCLFSESANNKVLSAVDQQMLYVQREFVVFAPS